MNELYWVGVGFGLLSLYPLGAVIEDIKTGADKVWWSMVGIWAYLVTQSTVLFICGALI